MKALHLVILLLSISTLVHAQEDNFSPRHTLTAQYGYGWFGLLNNHQGDIEISNDRTGNTQLYTANFDGSAATTIAYDYRFGRIFSLGGAVGFQSIDINGFRDSETNESISGAIDINRIFLSGRTLFHYGKNPKWDLYSGVRVGATLWNVDSSVDQDDFTLGTGVSFGSGTAIIPHLVPIPFGFKYYPDDRIMLGAELAVGSPHVIAFQVGVRL